MSKGRLEAFSDGVIAIIITIMVLDLKLPQTPDFAGLCGLAPVMLTYLMSFVFVGIYWNNHHHLLHVARFATGGIMWANLHLLFWLSLVPFATRWVGEHDTAALPTALYGVVLLLSGVAYTILQTAILSHHESGSAVRSAFGRDLKGKLSVVGYLTAIGAAFAYPLVSDVVYVLVALMWLIPDRRIERHVHETSP